MSDTLDWQTVRAVLEAADPVWAKLSNDAREPQWNFATKLLNIFRERTSPVCSHCQQKRNILTFYRCWDCKAFLCENCIKSHFGDNHTPHPKTVEQYDSELATLRARAERLEAALRLLLINSSLSTHQMMIVTDALKASPSPRAEAREVRDRKIIDLVIERAEQACRYALKHQNLEGDSEYRSGWEVAADVCEHFIKPHVEDHITKDILDSLGGQQDG